MLEIDAATLTQIEQHGIEGFPYEVCGLLVGKTIADRDGKTIRRIVVRAERTGNLNTERAHDRFDLDPGDYLRIELAATADRLDIVGVYHTHPNHPAIASETDRQRAAEVWGPTESWSYLITSIRDGEPRESRSWVLRGEQFSEEPIRIPAASAGAN